MKFAAFCKNWQKEQHIFCVSLLFAALVTPVTSRVVKESMEASFFWPLVSWELFSGGKRH
jgi:hypothetical protein